MAEQCLLRAVIKLHRVVRDSDPAGRIGPGRFGLVLEGVRNRNELQERMVRLVTAGLTPARGAALDIPLQFHVACVLLSERVMTAPLILRDLDRLLGGMSPRTRRPIRFLEPDESRVASARPAAGADGRAGAGGEPSSGGGPSQGSSSGLSDPARATR
jgi:two-component system, sensor histidine kinase LadS